MQERVDGCAECARLLDPLPEDQRLAATVQVRMTAAENRDLAALAGPLGRWAAGPSTVAREALHAHVAEHRAAS